MPEALRRAFVCLCVLLAFVLTCLCVLVFFVQVSIIVKADGCLVSFCVQVIGVKGGWLGKERGAGWYLTLFHPLQWSRMLAKKALHILFPHLETSICCASPGLQSCMILLDGKKSWIDRKCMALFTREKCQI